MANVNKSLSQTFGEKQEAIRKILRQLCEWKGEEIHEAKICSDHLHIDEDKLGDQMTMFGRMTILLRAANNREARL